MRTMNVVLVVVAALSLAVAPAAAQEHRDRNERPDGVPTGQRAVPREQGPPVAQPYRAPFVQEPSNQPWRQVSPEARQPERQVEPRFEQPAVPRERPEFESPRFTSPQFTSPQFTSPEFTSPRFTPPQVGRRQQTPSAVPRQVEPRQEQRAVRQPVEPRLERPQWSEPAWFFAQEFGQQNDRRRPEQQRSERQHAERPQGERQDRARPESRQVAPREPQRAVPREHVFPETERGALPRGQANERQGQERPEHDRQEFQFHLFAHPYYAFSPRTSLGFGIWLGYAVPYPFGALGYDQFMSPGAYGYPPPPFGALDVAPGAAYGGLSFTIVPDDAAVYVNGQYAGIVADYGPTDEPLTLGVGSYRVELDAPGYRPLEVSVNVVPGEVIPFNGSLQPY